MSRGNLFANIEDKFRSADKEKIFKVALASLEDFFKAFEAVRQLEENFKFGTMVVGARLGVAGDRVVNSQEKELIDEVFGRVWKGPMEEIYDMVGADIQEGDYEIVKVITRVGNSVAMPYLYYILSFAYIDGKIEDDVAERLESLFSANILASLSQGVKEEALAPKTSEENEINADVPEKETAITDAKLMKLIAKLEKWYPEHKAFAMDSIDSTLRENCATYAKSQGITVEQLLNKIGFELITGDAVYELRGPAKYSPGNEPEVIKSKIASVIRRLNEAYPDRIIKRSVQNDFKNLAKDMSGVIQWLGYKDTKDFLTAYGFNYTIEKKTGRPASTSADEVIEELKRRYPDGPAFAKQSELIAANPDLSGKLKTLSNSAKQRFGMSFKDYLYEQGLLSEGGHSSPDYDIEEMRTRCEQFVQSIKARYPEGSWFYSVVSLIDSNDDLRDEYHRLKEVWRKVCDKPLSDILKEEGILCTQNTAEQQWEKAVSLIRDNRLQRGCASDISELIKDIPDIDYQILNKLSNDAFGKDAKEKLSELGLLTLKLRGSMFKTAQEKDREIAAIKRAVAAKKESGKFFASVAGFAKNSLGVTYDSYEKLNKRFMELFGMDATEYLVSNGVLISPEKMIMGLASNYKEHRAYPDLINFLTNESKKVGEIKADPAAKAKRHDRMYSVDSCSRILRIAETVGCTNYNVSVKELDHIPVGTKVNIVRDPYNPFSKTNIRVETADGIRLGVLFKEIEDVLTPVLDLGIAKVENGEIVVMDLSRRNSPVIVVAFDLVAKKSEASAIDSLADIPVSDNLLTETILAETISANTSEWYETKMVSLPQKMSGKEFKTDVTWLGEKRFQTAGGLWATETSYDIKSTYGAAVFRGFRSQVDEAIRFIKEVKGKEIEASETKTPDIYEFKIWNTIDKDCPDIVGKLLKKYPCLKMVAFYESRPSSGSVVFSEPGYDHVTDYEHVGYFDPKSEYNFVWEEDPTQDLQYKFHYLSTEESGRINYRFPYKKEWDAFDYVFSSGDGFSVVTGIKLPNEIIQLGDFAYSYSDYLEKITLPSTIQRIGARAFVECRNLAKPEFEGEGTNLKWLGNHLVSLETGELMLAWNTTEIPTDPMVKGIGSFVYMGLSASEITIPENIVFIRDGAFKNCKKLCTIRIIGAVPEMTSAAFEGCKKIDSIIVPNASIKDVNWLGMQCALIEGFVELMQSDSGISEEVSSGGNDYIKLHNDVIADYFYDDRSILTYVTDNELLSPKATKSILDKVTKEKKAGLISLIQKYKNDKL